MLLSSMSTGDIMPAKSFVFGTNRTQWKTSDAYFNYITAGGTPAVDNRISRGGAGRNTGRGRSPSGPRTSRFHSPRLRTFCGAWFPPYWLLDITPQGTAEWRNLTAAVFSASVATTTTIGSHHTHHSHQPYMVDLEQPPVPRAPTTSTRTRHRWPNWTRTTTTTPSAGSSPWTRIHHTNDACTSKPSGPTTSLGGLATLSSQRPTTRTARQRSM